MNRQGLKEFDPHLMNHLLLIKSEPFGRSFLQSNQPIFHVHNFTRQPVFVIELRPYLPNLFNKIEIQTEVQEVVIAQQILLSNTRGQ